MKKTLYLFASSLLMLTSCSSDDDNSSPLVPVVPSEDISILPKTISYIYSEENRPSSIYTYEGNKIVRVTSKDRRKDFIYDGDLIVK